MNKFCAWEQKWIRKIRHNYQCHYRIQLVNICLLEIKAWNIWFQFVASSIFQQSVHEFDKSQISRSDNPKSLSNMNRYLSMPSYDPVRTHKFLLFVFEYFNRSFQPIQDSKKIIHYVFMLEIFHSYGQSMIYANNF